MPDFAESQPDNEQLARLRDQLKGRDFVPSTRHQAFSFQFFQKQIQELGNPYDLTRIPISVLRQMERDPVIAFGNYFIHVPIIRAKRRVECEDARIAAFVDNDLRRILASYIRNRKQAMNFGFKPMVKRFQLEIPNWKYIDPAKSDDELEVWPDKNVEAITHKPFVGLPSDPMICEPRWNAKGEFDGIKYQGGKNPIPFFAIENNEDGTKEIPVTHALWIANERETVNGSLWGWPRIGAAYRYWWSYWFRWALFDRFFERKADPPYVVYYPVGRQGDFAAENGNDPESMRDIALGIAESARAGGALAMPGDAIRGYDDRPTQMREWEISELEVKGDMKNFTESFEYLDIMKLRSLLISELAATEGSGGTSSRNVMAESLGFHKEGAGALADEIDDELNRFVIPDIVRANFPQFKGDCRIKTTSFSESDQNTMEQALQWIGQSDASALRNIDIRELLERLGMPLVSHAEIRRQEKEAEKALQEDQPDVIEPQVGKAGVNEQGFYVQPRERLILAESNTEFLSKLPPTKHYSDKTVRALMTSLRGIWKKTYKAVYEDFAQYLSKQNFSELQLADEDQINKIIKRWRYSRKDLDESINASRDKLQRIIARAGNLELRRGGFQPNFTVDSEDVASWLDERGLEFAHAIDETVREELRTFLAGAISEEMTQEQVASAVREHFADFPDWKADRLVRSETRNSFNFATLAAGEAAGVKIVQAVDAQHGPTDAECEDRNGRFFRINKAFNEIAKEHPNGTLEFRLIPGRENLSVKKVENIPDDKLAYFDSENDIIYLANDIPFEIESEYLMQLGDTLINGK